MAKRKAITKKTRFEVFKRDKFTCQYCGSSAPDVILEVDHIEPVSAGGGNDMFNLVTSCRACNAGKKDRKLSDNHILIKQKEELEQLEEARQQRRMILQWKKELSDSAREETDDFCEYFNYSTGYNINEDSELYKVNLPKMLKRYGFKVMCDAIDAGIKSYVRLGDKSEHNKILDKLGGIAYNISQQKDNPYHIESTKLLWRYIKARKYIDRNYYCSKQSKKNVIDIISDLLESGADGNDISMIIDFDPIMYFYVHNVIANGTKDNLDALTSYAAKLSNKGIDVSNVVEKAEKLYRLLN